MTSSLPSIPITENLILATNQNLVGIFFLSNCVLVAINYYQRSIYIAVEQFLIEHTLIIIFSKINFEIFK